MSHRPVTSMGAPVGDALSLVLQGFPSSVTDVTDVTDYNNTYTRTRARAHTRARTRIEFGVGDIGPLGDIGDRQTRVLSRGGPVGGGSDPTIFRFSVFPDSTFARVPS